MTSAIPWYCRYGVHGDIAKQVNVDGTVVYRTRERPCDCEPPQRSSWNPHPPPRRAAASSSVLPWGGSRRSEGLRLRRGNGVAPRPSPYQMPLAGSYVAASCAADNRSNPYLQIVVPPLTMEDLTRCTLGLGRSQDLVAEQLMLPSIPIIQPRRASANAPDTTTITTAPLGVGDAGDSTSFSSPLPASHPTPQTAASNVGLATSRSEASPNSAVPLGASGTSTAPTAPPGVCNAPCTPEQHDVDRNCGFVFCPTCGLRITAASTDGGVTYTTTTCPLAPHEAPPMAGDVTKRPSMVLGRYCFLCGADTQGRETVASEGAAPPPAAAAPSTDTGATDAPGGSTASPHDPGTLAAPAPVLSDAIDVRADLRTVDDVMAHLLHNAVKNGGTVRPPCGLPHCRLCGPSTATADASWPKAGGAPPSVSASQPSSWWGMPVMCGSPAIAIIHNHFGRS